MSEPAVGLTTVERESGRAPSSSGERAASSTPFRWSTWSLTRKLPVLTAAIIIVVMATSLIVMYGALRRARVDSVREHLHQLARQIANSSELSMRTRLVAFRQAATDSSVIALLRASSSNSRPASPALVAAASEALLKLRSAPDSSLTIELWTPDQRRVVHVGTDIRGDSLLQVRPELRTLNGRRAAEVPVGTTGPDSIRYGAFYASGGHMLYWTVVPVSDNGRRRLGYLAQLRAYRGTVEGAHTIKELIGRDVNLYLNNTTDGFWSDVIGNTVPTLRREPGDTGTMDYRGERPGVGKVMVSTARIANSPWAISLEIPVQAVMAEPRETLGRLALVSLVIGSLGVLVAWFASREITKPLVALTSVAGALARGDFSTRAITSGDASTRDELARLGDSFNRMASEIEQSHRLLERQVREARTMSEQLAETNQQLTHVSATAEDARDIAQKANRAKGDFLAVMSHELRTPLNAIGGYSDILKLGIYGPLNAEQHDAIDRIGRSQQLLLALINDVLNFARLDAGRVQYVIRHVNLREALEAAEPLVAPQLAARQLTYRLQPCDPTTTVSADPDKLQQVMLNLLSNAIKFTSPGGSITVWCELVEDFAAIHVTDTGMGIRADRLDAIFDPFVQVDRALNRPHEGVGLGLSISRDLARGMGGSLTVKSVPNEGSTFTLQLPLAPRNS